MVLFGIGAVLSLLQILSFRADHIVQGLVTSVVNGYCFVALYSLYNMFKREYEGGINTEYRQFEKV